MNRDDQLLTIKVTGEEFDVIAHGLRIVEGLSHARSSDVTKREGEVADVLLSVMAATVKRL